MNSNKSALAAFLLSFIPGLGHLYMGRYVRAVLYGGGFFGPVLLSILMMAAGRYYPWGLAKILLLFAFLAAVVNMLDMIVSLLLHKNTLPAYNGEGAAAEEALHRPPYSLNNDRTQVLLFSFIPGLGHFQLGLMQRGVAFLISFFGLAVMVIFVAFLTNRGGFLVFLGILPVIWLYGMFDALQLSQRKERGEALVDRTVFEDFQEARSAGKKNKMLAMLLAVFPGAGHMYLGLQRRGLQLMAAFLLAIYVLDVLHLSFFMFLIPILWCFSFFDALQLISKHGTEEVADVPVVDWLFNHQKWVGFALLALGAYYLLDQVLLSALDTLFPMGHVSMWFHRYFQTFVISIVLIGGGMRLISGTKKTRE